MPPTADSMNTACPEALPPHKALSGDEGDSLVSQPHCSFSQRCHLQALLWVVLAVYRAHLLAMCSPGEASPRTQES